MTPSKKRSETEDKKGTKLLQVRISLDVWREIEIRRHQKTLAEARNVTQAEVVEEFLRKGFKGG